MSALTCFEAYDIRGRLGVDLDASIAYRIGRAFAQVLGAQRVVLGRDCRQSSPELAAAVAQALVDEGVEVLDLGLSGTEEMYFATSHFGADGGVCVTASHNPIDWNGLKMVQAGSAPLDPVAQYAAMRDLAERDAFGAERPGGRVSDVAQTARAAYVARVLSLVEVTAMRPLTILVNAGNGAAGPTFDALAAELSRRDCPLHFLRMNHTPDGRFPNGIPNPLLPETRPAMAEAVRTSGADFGVAWDGDFDRCFLFDHTGAFVDGEYVVGLLADAYLRKHPGETIIHDPRIIWNTQDIVAQAGGRAVHARTGHVHIKQAMRDENAVYGGEMSAHHYFRDFMFCDSGMIPWLLIAELVSRDGGLADLVGARRAAFPSSGEINFTLDDPQAAMDRVLAEFGAEAIGIDRIDGIGIDLGTWRFNLRLSNTEAMIRLNVEAREDAARVTQGIARVKTCLFG